MKNILIIVAFMLAATTVYPNNISITNLSTPGINTSAGPNNPANFRMIEFDLSWENSWRMSIGPSNWDAAWVFVKYRVSAINGGDGIWKNAAINNTGQTAPAGCTMDLGLLNQSLAYNASTNPVMGVFIYRSADGNGTNTFNDIQLRWNYGFNGVLDATSIDIQVFAVEMVYIPGGLTFNVGGGGGTSAYASTNISTATASAIGSGYPAGFTNSNGAFPNGYNKIYCMKYEISQKQWVDFLNTLTYTQQTTRTNSAPNSVAGTAAYSNTFRNGIDIQTPGINPTMPAVYACNEFPDNNFNDGVDGLGNACNFINWADLAAYLDWAGLRPMTELEYEKICRGDIPPITNEYAWGTTYISAITTFGFGGYIYEFPEPYGIANASFSQGFGPLRVGAFASVSTTRVLSGSAYYGVMEMSGNVQERAVTAGNNPTFTGSHGNGLLLNSGDADVSGWPSLTTATGLGFRGGAWDQAAINLQLSDRTSASTANNTRLNNSGGRGVRTAP